MLVGPVEAPQAQLCECFLRNDSGKPWPEFRYEFYDVIFAGHVRSIEMLNDDSRHHFKDRARITRFDVETQWKGEQVDSVSIVAPDPMVQCDYPFDLGKRYLVYAYVDDRITLNGEPILRAWICEFFGTSPIKNAQENIVALDSLSAARGYSQ